MLDKIKRLRHELFGVFLCFQYFPTNLHLTILKQTKYLDLWCLKMIWKTVNFNVAREQVMRASHWMRESENTIGIELWHSHTHFYGNHDIQVIMTQSFSFRDYLQVSSVFIRELIFIFCLFFFLSKYETAKRLHSCTQRFFMLVICIAYSRDGKWSIIANRW